MYKYFTFKYIFVWIGSNMENNNKDWGKTETKMEVSQQRLKVSRTSFGGYGHGLRNVNSKSISIYLSMNLMKINSVMATYLCLGNLFETKKCKLQEGVGIFLCDVIIFYIV